MTVCKVDPGEEQPLVLGVKIGKRQESRNLFCNEKEHFIVSKKNIQLHHQTVTDIIVQNVCSYSYLVKFNSTAVVRK